MPPLGFEPGIVYGPTKIARAIALLQGVQHLAGGHVRSLDAEALLIKRARAELDGLLQSISAERLDEIAND